MQTMTDSPEFDFVPRVVSSHIQLKWMARWTDLHEPLHDAGDCRDPEFHAHDHTTCPEALTDFYTMCDKIHGKEVLNLQRCRWTGNVFTMQRKAQCSQETPNGQIQQ